jgi:hypothetical protein
MHAAAAALPARLDAAIGALVRRMLAAAPRPHAPRFRVRAQGGKGGVGMHGGVAAGRFGCGVKGQQGCDALVERQRAPAAALQAPLARAACARARARRSGRTARERRPSSPRSAARCLFSRSARDWARCRVPAHSGLNTQSLREAFSRLSQGFAQGFLEAFSRLSQGSARGLCEGLCAGPQRAFVLLATVGLAPLWAWMRDGGADVSRPRLDLGRIWLWFCWILTGRRFPAAAKE